MFKKIKIEITDEAALLAEAKQIIPDDHDMEAFLKDLAAHGGSPEDPGTAFQWLKYCRAHRLFPAFDISEPPAGCQISIEETLTDGTVQVTPLTEDEARELIRNNLLARDMISRVYPAALEKHENDQKKEKQKED